MRHAGLVQRRRLELTLSAAELAAATSIGLTAGRPLIATRVVGLPHIKDVAMTTAPSSALPRRAALVTLWRRQLLDDLRREAARAGAAGVCAIAFHQRDLGQVDQFSERRMIELTATGVPLVATGRRGNGHHLFRTSLSTHDLVALVRAGWMAADVVVSGRTEVRPRKYQANDASVVTDRRNSEIVGATHIVTAARAAVRDDLARQARTLGADGLLCGRFSTEWSGTRHVVEVMGLGEAVVRWGSVRWAPPSRHAALGPKIVASMGEWTSRTSTLK
jgi:uncharacterized protein YbjQ (UPF0145 family)